MLNTFTWGQPTMDHHDSLPLNVATHRCLVVSLVFILSSLKDIKPSKKHNRHLGNERHPSVSLELCQIRVKKQKTFLET